MNTERRRYKRITCQLPVGYIDLHKAGSIAAESLIGNMDSGGVSFEADGFVPMAGRLLLAIRLPNMTRSIKAISKVVWIRKSPSDRRYLLGAKFLDMSKDDKSAVADFIAVQTI